MEPLVYRNCFHIMMKYKIEKYIKWEVKKLKYLQNLNKILLLFHRAFFVHLVFHQLMHSYILLKYYHRQLL